MLNTTSIARMDLGFDWSERTVGDITSILGVSILECYMIWRSARDFFRNDVYLRLFTFIQRKKHISNALQKYILPSPGRQFVLYSNFAPRCPNLRKDMYDILHETGNDGYTVSLVGEDFSEQKEFSVCTFIGDINLEDLVVGYNFSLSSGNVGIDHSNGYYGFVNEFPSSVHDVAQIIGRFGRRPGASSCTDAIDIRRDLDGYLSMLRRIPYSLNTLKTTKKNLKESERCMRIDLQVIIDLLVLRLGCIHARIANTLSKPGSFKFDPLLVRC